MIEKRISITTPEEQTKTNPSPSVSEGNGLGRQWRRIPTVGRVLIIEIVTLSILATGVIICRYVPAANKLFTKHPLPFYISGAILVEISIALSFFAARQPKNLKKKGPSISWWADPKKGVHFEKKGLA